RVRGMSHFGNQARARKRLHPGVEQRQLSSYGLRVRVGACKVGQQSLEAQVVTGLDDVHYLRQIALWDAESSHTGIDLHVVRHLTRARVVGFFLEFLELTRAMNHRRETVMNQLCTAGAEVAAHD